MILTEQEQTLLDLITSHGGGKKVRELERETGLNYQEIIKTSRSLISKGYGIRGIGVSDWIERLFLSPYDKNYETLIQK
ncbi:hypothetical protein [Pseudalkalibacillus decolorationis]|uniref:hypothetical protein n=1 Tax=Pseudalkalibacillus decolorationis TaxID=163879 RepID=UPI002147AEDD|nr:hypothetical protein [Pseudalkalibacillus decolorationis]